MIWLIFGFMLLAATILVIWPLIRYDKRLSLYSIATFVFIIVLPATIYTNIGAPSAGSEMASIQEMVTGLDERLREDPDDLAGWKMLGRSYFELRNYKAAIEAFERAVKMESGSNGQTLADLGEAVWMHDQREMIGRAGDLFENALAMSPSNSKALFYSGLVAIARDERFLAAERWEALLELSPNEEIQEILRQRISQLRSEEVVVQEMHAAPIISVTIELAAAVAEVVKPDSTVFVIAKDPAKPSPPIAVIKRQVVELPVVVALSDSDSMIPGRVLSGFSEFIIVARVSMSGQPIAQSGDWYGEEIVRPSQSSEISIVIERKIQ
jgi:cytochrome c-type biogenesis protein CcmH